MRPPPTPPPARSTPLPVCGRTGPDGVDRHEAADCPWFVQLAEAVPLGIAAIDVGERVVHANAAFFRISGHAPHQLLHRTLDETVVPDFLRGGPVRSGRVDEAGAAVETFFRRRDGSLVEVAVRRVPLRAEAAVIGGIVIVEDLAERRLADAERAGSPTRQRPDDVAATAADRRRALVAKVERLLAAGPDAAQSLGALAGALVPELADSCILYLLDPERRVHRIGIAFAEPDQEELLREQLDHYPAPVSPLIPPVARVLSTGEAELIPEVSIGALKAVPGDRDHVSVALLVGLSALLVVPIPFAGRTLGAISLAMAGSGRDFQAADLIAAEEIARLAGRAAVPITPLLP